MKLTGAELTMKLLERQGIDVVAGIPGGANLPLYNALYRSNIRHILCRHEQGAGFLAQGITRSTGKPAVCFATSGPGATNVITAIADAKLDSIPIIVITGQVSSTMIGTDAFQEVDTYGISIPVTKHNFLVRDVSELTEVIPEAFSLAQSGRPGPVLIDIPKNVQNQTIEIEVWPEPGKAAVQEEPDLGGIRTAAEMINRAEKPVFYIGGGIVHAGVSEKLKSIAEKGNIPVAVTLMGLGCFPSEHPLYMGMLGMHGARYTNLLLEEADLVIALGVRFDDRATGNIGKFCKNAAIIHIDIDEAEIHKNRQANVFVVGDAGLVLSQLEQQVEENSRSAWMAEIAGKKAEYPFRMPESKNFYHPINIISGVASLLKPDTIITTDVGQHQMWVAQSYPFQRPRTLLTSGGLGTMGFGLPAAIGAAQANPGRKVVCFSGDGSLLMNIQELATLADLGLDVTVIVMNNGHLGLVRQQQELFYDHNYIACRFETRTDYVKVAEGFGIRGIRLDGRTDPRNVLEQALVFFGPVLIDVPIGEEENVFPIVPPGAANYEMIGGEEDAG